MRHRISPATVVSLVALFFSLTGAGVAATGYRITSLWQLAPKVRHQLRGQRGHTGPVGPQGPQGVTGAQGPSGPQGAPGSPGLIDWGDVYLVNADSQTLTSANQTVVAVCRPSDHAITGGFDGTAAIVTTSIPYAGAGRAGDSGWAVTAHLDPSATTATFAVWALCS